MAIYHFSGTIISRSQGRSAVACAAYRSAEKLQDERYDREHDYTQKQDVAYKEILLPEGAPAWMADREKLWNAVEAAENRKDAQLAREFNIALPRELTLSQNTELAKAFVQQAFVDKGMVADLCIHNDKASNGETQPHVHVMLTLREVTPDGFGQKVREWNDKSNLLQWREAWADMANRTFQLHDHDMRIDHRSLKEQGIDLEPQYKIGASVAQPHMARFEDHQRIARENGERILANPSIALDALTKQQSTFTQQDLARFVNRHTMDAEQFQQVLVKVQASPELVSLGHREGQVERFTTQDMLKLEGQLFQSVHTLTQREGHQVDASFQKEALTTRALSSDQKTAFDHLVGQGDLKCVVGYAGTGKSYLLGAAKEAWESEGYRVLGATLSGIAAENLEGSSGIDSRTLASRCYYWDKGEELLTSKDILVVDEAGMIGSRQMARLLGEAESHGAKVVLIGDPQQLQAIEAGAAFRAVAEKASYVELTDIRRQVEPWQQQVTFDLAQGRIEQAVTAYERQDHVHAFETQAAAKQALVEMWNDTRLANADKSQIMLAYTRKDALSLNEMARDLLRKDGVLGEDRLCQTERGERVFAEQDRVYFLKNDRALGVMNGTLGTIEKIDNQVITIGIDNVQANQPIAKTQVTVDLEKYNHLEYGYAATIHKAQGVTVDRSYVLASRHIDAHATYVGLSRHREGTELFWSREEFASRADLTQGLSRDRSKDMAVDYVDAEKTQADFAKYRGIEAVPRDDLPVLSAEDKALWEAARAFDQKATQQDKSEARESGIDLLLFKDAYERTQGLSSSGESLSLENKKSPSLPSLDEFDKEMSSLGRTIKDRSDIPEKPERAPVKDRGDREIGEMEF